MVETIGKRIAYLRQKYGWTQQSLADRLAISRVAISHIEMDLTIPSERSITLMAGIFKLSPIDLVEGTTYRRAKAERLPELANLYTELELQLALLINDSTWLNQLENQTFKSDTVRTTLQKWSDRLAAWKQRYLDEHESDVLLQMDRILKDLKSQTGSPPS